MGISLDNDSDWPGWLVFEAVFACIFVGEIVIKSVASRHDQLVTSDGSSDVTNGSNGLFILFRHRPLVSRYTLLASTFSGHLGGGIALTCC